MVVAQMFPYYVCTIIFLMPYLAAELYYTMDVSFYIDQIDNGGNITEPDPPPDVLDLSDVSLFQSCVFVFAMPCILIIQCIDFCRALRAAYGKYYKDQPMFQFPSVNDPKSKYAAKQPTKKNRVLRRIWKTFARWFRGAK